jgi:hypothetical protein
MERIFKPNVIIVSGSGKKVGKTLLVTEIIKHFSAQAPVIALKISPHRHEKLGNVSTITDKPGYRLFRELDVNEKNSGQFLAAGAVASYFLETEDGFLEKAMDEFFPACNPLNHPVVCESGALGTIIKPGLMIFITPPGNILSPYKESVRKLADMELPARKFSPAEVVKRIRLAGDCWLKK